ncbi:MAG: histidine kinase [Bacteroidota bacterium]
MPVLPKQSTAFSMRQFWVLNSAYWGGLFTIDLLQTLAWQSVREKFDLAYNLMQYGPYFLWLWGASFGLFVLFQRFRSKVWHVMLPRWVGFILPISAFCTVATIMTSMGLIRTFRGSEYGFMEALGLNLTRMYPLIFGMITHLATLVLLLYVIDFYRKYKTADLNSRELESRLTQAELMTLRMQLQPHFLFNAMNTIAMQVRGGANQRAVDMLSGLSDLLRTSLARAGRTWIPLKEEFDLVKAYLAIEAERFSDTLEVELDIDPQVLGLRVPNLILQPLVENAFKHGISKVMGKASIRISARREGNYLHIRIQNSGPDLEPGFQWREAEGIGLRNTWSRLQGLYGEDFRLGLTQCGSQMICLNLHFPASTPLTSS